MKVHLHRASFLRTTAFRLALLYAVVFCASVLALFAFIYWTTTTLLDRQREQTIVAEMGGLTDEFATVGLSGLAEEIAARTRSDRVGASIYLLARPDLTPVVGNLSGWPKNATHEGPWMKFWVDRQLFGDPERHRVRALHVRLPGDYHVLVGQDIHAQDRFEATMIDVLIWSEAIALALGIGGGFLMSRNTLRRIEAINRVAEQVMRGRVKQRIPVTGGRGELDRLAANLNSMLDEIERLLASIRTVTTNIAHDLRSPLTRVKTRLEMALRADGSVEQRRDAIEQAVAESDQLLATFNALLSIADAEASAGHANLVPVDLEPLAQDVAELYQPLAEERGVSLVASLAGPTIVAGNRHLLFQAVANLVDNAVKHSPRGSRIDLAVRTLAEGPQIAVADNGPGIPEPDRGRVLERFVRLDASRTTPGSGLGLSLVAAIVRMHGAELRLEDNSPGLRAIIGFHPLPATAPAPEAKAA